MLFNDGENDVNWEKNEKRRKRKNRANECVRERKIEKERNLIF
jgi:hypothetical protein